MFLPLVDQDEEGDEDDKDSDDGQEDDDEWRVEEGLVLTWKDRKDPKLI